MFSKLLNNGSSKPFRSDCATSVVFSSLGRFKVLVSENASGADGATNEFDWTLVLFVVAGAGCVVGDTGVGFIGFVGCFEL